MSEITLPQPPEWFKREQSQATPPQPKPEPNAETLTATEIHSWSPQEMRKYMQVPALRAKIEAIAAEITQQAFAQQRKDELKRQADLMGEEYVDEDEVAAQQAAADAEAARVAAEAAEQQRLADEATRKAAEAEAARLAAEAAKPKKIVVEYQVRDENGNPIGRPTHLEATSEEEMRQKLIKAHEEATRGFHRLKKQLGNVKETYAKKAEPAVPAAPVLNDAEIMQALKDLKSDDPQVQLNAHQKLTKSEVDRQLAAQRAEREAHDAAARASQEFLARHKKDYNNINANNVLIGQYIQDNELDWTLDNLEVAFAALESQLAPVEQPVATVTQTNPVQQPAATTPTATQQPVASSTTVAAQTSASSTVATTETPAAAANTATQQRRPGVNGSVEPGSSSVPRPRTPDTTTDIGLTLAEIKSWNPQTMRRNMGNPAMRQKIEAVLLRENSPEKVAARQKKIENQLRLAGQAR